MGNSFLEFKVNPGLYNPFSNSKKHHYHILVFNSKTAMWLAQKESSSPDEKYHDGGFRALTIAYKQSKGDPPLLKAKIGFVLLCRDYLNLEVLSHEAVHMSTNFLRIYDALKLGSDFDDYEENLACCIGSCTKQIIDKLRKAKLL